VAGQILRVTGFEKAADFIVGDQLRIPSNTRSHNCAAARHRLHEGI